MNGQSYGILLTTVNKIILLPVVIGTVKTVASHLSKEGSKTLCGQMFIQSFGKITAESSS